MGAGRRRLDVWQLNAYACGRTSRQLRGDVDSESGLADEGGSEKAERGPIPRKCSLSLAGCDSVTRRACWSTSAVLISSGTADHHFGKLPGHTLLLSCVANLVSLLFCIVILILAILDLPALLICTRLAFSPPRTIPSHRAWMLPHPSRAPSTCPRRLERSYTGVSYSAKHRGASADPQPLRLT